MQHRTEVNSTMKERPFPYFAQRSFHPLEEMEFSIKG